MTCIWNEDRGFKSLGLPLQVKNDVRGSWRENYESWLRTLKSLFCACGVSCNFHPFRRKLRVGWKGINEAMSKLDLEFFFSLGHHSSVIMPSSSPAKCSSAMLCFCRSCLHRYNAIHYISVGGFSYWFSIYSTLIVHEWVVWIVNLKNLFSNGVLTVRYGAKRGSSCC